MPTENPTNVITAIVVALEKVDSIEFVRTSSSEPRTTTMDDGRPLLFLLVVMVAGWKWISIPPSFPFLGQERRKICFGYADWICEFEMGFEGEGSRKIETSRLEFSDN